MQGTNGIDIFMIDDVPGISPNIDIVGGFSRDDGDTLRFQDDRAAADATSITLYIDYIDDGKSLASGLHNIMFYRTQGDEASALAQLINMPADFTIHNDDICEDVTFVDFVVPEVV